MYCVIRAKNSYGNYRSDTFYVSASGYPLDDYDRRCYSDKLNCDLINNALAAHFGKPSTDIIGNLIGGMNMHSDVRDRPVRDTLAGGSRNSSEQRLGRKFKGFLVPGQLICTCII